MLMNYTCLCQGLDSAWRSSTPGSALGTLLRSPEPPGDPLQEPGSDFRSALQCAPFCLAHGDCTISYLRCNGLLAMQQAFTCCQA